MLGHVGARPRGFVRTTSAALALALLIAALTVVAPPTPASAAEPTAPGAFVSITPQRLLDTRIGLGSAQIGPVAPGATIRLQVSGRAGIPSGTSAVVMNVTAVSPTAHGFLTVYPSGGAQPTASNVNFSAGDTIPNQVTVKVGTDGFVNLTNNSAGDTHLLADAAGHYLGGTPTAAGAFMSLAPARILDTRVGIAANDAVAASGTLTLPVAGSGGVPSTGVSSVLMNVTVTEPSAAGFLTAYPSGTSQPTASNLNFRAGLTIPNLVAVKLGADGAVALTNNSPGPAHVIADVAGYYLAGTPTQPGTFVSLSPTRLMDSRDGSGISGSPGADGRRSTQVTGRGGIPSTGVGAVVMNLTATNAGTYGYVTAYPSTTGQPFASNLNYVRGQTIPNLTTVKVGTDGRVIFANSGRGSVALIGDAAGYFLGDPALPVPVSGVVWSAEFEGAAGTPVDPATWSISTRGDGYGNGEQQVYTARPENLSLDGNGSLRITARQETFIDPRGITGNYTSGRIETKTRFAYGRIEARIKVPQGPGLWSAFWLYGDDRNGQDWPAVGEVDIMELLGNTRDLHSTVIGGRTSGERWTRQGTTLGSAPFADEWHVYAVDWTKDALIFSVDGRETYRLLRSSLSSDEQWPFDRPSSITLNLAVGGSWPGPPNTDTVFPAEMLVDYVRVSNSRVVDAD
ncbi:MAG: glycoside hydrolase family 16 protein [Microbacterium sp.]